VDRVSSRQNPIVRRFRELARTGADDRVLVDGEHLVTEALGSGVALELVAISERLVRGRLAPLAASLTDASVKTLAVTEPVLAAISPVQHSSGVVGIARLGPSTLDRALERAPQLVLFVSDVQDPGNMGAIVRAAEACGATGIVAGRGCADPFGWKALRGAMGSTFRVPVASRHDLTDAAGRARRAGLTVLATVPRGGSELPAVDLRSPCAIVLGGEGAGLPHDLLDAADQRVTIPMRPPVESLNVAVAAAIVLYEAWRQREIRRPARKGAH
jgi:TrmH family RNA methyltransferase